MIQDTEITNVSFYIATYEPNESDEQPIKEVLAVFIDTRIKSFDNIDFYYDCYAHLGQHSTCSELFLAQKTKKANEIEYKELFNELTNSIGYNLKIV